ncbi:MAG: helix-turn-helix transcriptional regulator, partial [Actinomycetota bacterium]|nr:helix-turn-helix transcriptional regulator [Actinomycetota bacterium]
AIDENVTASLENIAAARDLVELTESPLIQTRVSLQTARLRLARFELSAAEEAVQHALEMCHRYHLPLLGVALGVSAQIGAQLGDTGRVRACEKEAKDLTLVPEDRIALYEADTILRLVRGDVTRAEATLAQATELISSDHREQFRWLASLHILFGALKGRPTGGPPEDPLERHAYAISLGKSGDAQAAEAEFATADHDLQPFPWRRHLARRFAAEASLEDRWGNPSEWLLDTAAFFDSAGQVGLASATKGLLRRAGVAVPRRGRGQSPVPEALLELGITSREMDVLGLLLEGVSNREIAERLYVSPRTVESHVASSMRKVGVESRGQLVAFILDKQGPRR